jgi:cytochrome c biogenesis protein
LPQDANFKSVGVIKVPDARPDRLAFQGFFLPTGAITADDDIRGVSVPKQVYLC